MKTKTKIIILLIVIWQSLLAAGFLFGCSFAFFSSGLPNFSFYFHKNFFYALFEIIQYTCFWGFIPVAIVGSIGLLKRRNYGRIFSITSMSLLILGVCFSFAQSLFYLYLSEFFIDSSNMVLLAFSCINVLAVIYLDRLKIARNQTDAPDNS